MNYVNDDRLRFRTMTILKSVIFIMVLGVLSACGEDITPEQHLEKAKTFLGEKKIFEGIIEIKNALQKEGNLPEARWLLGNAYLKLGNGALAQREINSARSLGFSHEEMELKVFQALNQQGKYQEVLDKTGAMQATDNSTELQVIRGDALVGLGQLDDAKSAYENALVQDKSKAAAYAGLSRIALSQRDQEQSEKYIEQGLAVAPDSDDLWVLKGMLALVRNAAPEAEEYFAHADEIAPYNRMAKIGLIRSRFAQEKFEEALPPLRYLEGHYGKAATINYLRAYYEYSNKNIDKAKELLFDVLKVNPDHPESLLLISNILYQDGKSERVIDYLERFNTQFPGHLPAVKLLAVSYLAKEEINKTIELIESLLATRPADDQLYSILGTAYIRSGNLDKATEYLEKAAEINPDAANIRAQLALSHLAAGNTELAISGLEDAVKLNPKLYSADIMLILTHIRSEDFDAAIKAAENLHSKEPENPLPLNLLGTAYAGKKNYEQAREYFNLALQIKPDFSPARFNLANLDIEAGNLDSAEQRFRDIIRDNEKNAKAWVGLAKIADKQGDEAKMLEYLQQARSADERSIEARILLARYYKNTSRPREMLGVITEASKLAPNFTEVVFLSAQAQRLNGQYGNARKNLDVLLSNFPESVDLLMESALIHMALGELETAEQTIDRILTIQADHERAMLAQINLYLRMNRPDKAKSSLDKYAAAYPDSPDLDISRGDLAMIEKDYTRALQHYEKAFKEKNKSPVMFRIVNAYQAMDDNETAIMKLEKWTGEHPDDNQVSLVLATHYTRIGELEKAATVYERIVRNNPDNVVALNNLAWMYLEVDPNKARELSEKAYQLAPDQPDVQDTFGWILIQQGDQLERGVTLIRTALDKKPDNPSIRYHYAAGLAKSGDREQAISELKKSFDKNIPFSESDEARSLLQELQK